MKRIIKNEIKKLIKRFPTEYELNSVIEYIDFYSDEETTGNDLRGLVSDWVDENMAQCECCGMWELKTDMISKCYGYLCSELCEYEYDRCTYSQSDVRSEYEFNVLNR